MNAELALYVYRKRPAVEVAGDHGATPFLPTMVIEINPRTIEESIPRESPDCLKRRYLGGHIPLIYRVLGRSILPVLGVTAGANRPMKVLSRRSHPLHAGKRRSGWCEQSKQPSPTARL